MTNLQEKIENLNLEISSQLPKEITIAFAKSISDLKNKEIENKAVMVGDKIIPFTLKSVDNTNVSSSSLLEEYDKVILVFFRGNWCPYCNLELKAFQDTLDTFNEKKIKLLAISPQKLEYSLTLTEENHLTFDILHDENNRLAKTLNISFQLQDFVLPYYSQLGVDLKKYNGDEEDMLPIPAVFVINKNHMVTYSFVDSDYMNRVDIDELIRNL